MDLFFCFGNKYDGVVFKQCDSIYNDIDNSEGCFSCYVWRIQFIRYLGVFWYIVCYSGVVYF